MKRNSVLATAQVLMVLLAVAMILLGVIFSEKFSLPPIITGIGFLIIAWTFTSLKRKEY